MTEKMNDVTGYLSNISRTESDGQSQRKNTQKEDNNEKMKADEENSEDVMHSIIRQTQI